MKYKVTVNKETKDVCPLRSKMKIGGNFTVKVNEKDGMAHIIIKSIPSKISKAEKELSEQLKNFVNNPLMARPTFDGNFILVSKSLTDETISDIIKSIKNKLKK